MSCRGSRIAIRPAGSDTEVTLDIRVLDSGVAFRWVVPSDGKSRVPDETTTFVLPAQSTVWFHDLEGHYEGTYTRKPVAEVPEGQWVAPPLTYRLPKEHGYASISEAALSNYSGMALRCDGRRGFAVALGHKHPPSYPFRLRYAADVERMSKPAAIDGTITTPWRVVMLGADLNALVQSELVNSQCPAPDPKLFPEGAYETLEVRDDGTDPTAVKIVKSSARREDTVTLDLRGGGGYVGRFTRPRE